MGGDEYVRRARENERTRRQKAESEASARRKNEEWWEECQRKHRQKADQEQQRAEAAEARRTEEEAARERERTRQEQQQQAEAEAEWERNKEARIKAKWTEITQPLDAEFESLWSKIQVMGDILKSLDTIDDTYASQRGRYQCSWDKCFDRGTTFESAETLFEEKYTERNICRLYVLDQRELYWEEIGEEETRKIITWEREMYKKEGLQLTDWWNQHAEQGQRNEQIRRKREELRMEEEVRSEARSQREKMAIERRKFHTTFCLVQATKEETERRDRAEFEAWKRNEQKRGSRRGRNHQN